MTAARVVLADPRRLIRDSVSEALTLNGIDVAATAGDSRATMLQAQRTLPDVVAVAGSLLGPLPRLCAALREIDPAPRVLIIDGDPDDEALLQAIEAGVDGYLTGDSGIDVVSDAVRALATGESVVPPSMLGPLLRRLIQRHREATQAVDQLVALTPREREVLVLLVDGLDDEGMAQRLFISPETARTHVQRILRKLDVHSRVEAVALVAEAGLIDRLERMIGEKAS